MTSVNRLPTVNNDLEATFWGLSPCSFFLHLRAACSTALIDGFRSNDPSMYPSAKPIDGSANRRQAALPSRILTSTLSLLETASAAMKSRPSGKVNTISGRGLDLSAVLDASARAPLQTHLKAVFVKDELATNGDRGTVEVVPHKASTAS